MLKFGKCFDYELLIIQNLVFLISIIQQIHYWNPWNTGFYWKIWCLDNGLFGYWRMGEFKLVIQRIKMNEKYLLNTWHFLSQSFRKKTKIFSLWQPVKLIPATIALIIPETIIVLTTRDVWQDCEEVIAVLAILKH